MRMICATEIGPTNWRRDPRSKPMEGMHAPRDPRPKSSNRYRLASLDAGFHARDRTNLPFVCKLCKQAPNNPPWRYRVSSDAAASSRPSCQMASIVRTPRSHDPPVCLPALHAAFYISMRDSIRRAAQTIARLQNVIVLWSMHLEQEA